MLRRILFDGISTLMLFGLILFGLPNLGHAQVSVNIGINLPGPPQLVPVPATAVMYAPGVGANYFFYGSEYYVFANGGWYVSPRHNGPWVLVAPEFVPRPILMVPIQYYRVPPPAWQHWRRDAAPRWEPHWGQRWEERGPAERAQQRDEPRGPRDEDHRGERREGRR
jgi:hypothetical protein